VRLPGPRGSGGEHVSEEVAVVVGAVDGGVCVVDGVALLAGDGDGDAVCGGEEGGVAVGGGVGHGSRFGVEALASCPLTIHPVPPPSTVCSHNRNASSTLLATPAMPPAAWTVSSHARCSGRMRAGRGLDLDAGKHRHLLAHHVRGDRDGPVADEVGAAFAEAKLHRSAVLVAQRAGVIAEEPGSAGAAGYADVLLDLLFRWQGLAAASVVAA
jgi:hypothetical protein